MPIIIFLIILFTINLLAKPGNENNLLYVDISPPTDFIQQPFDVLHYDVQLDLTKAPARDVIGICDIKVAWIDSPQNNKFYFHLRDLLIDSIFYQNQPVTAIVWGTPDSAAYHWEIQPPTGIIDDTVTIRIYYHGKMEPEPGNNVWGGVLTSSTGICTIGVGFHNNYVSCTQHWMPCYDHPSDKATFHGRFRVKNPKSVASNGILNIEHVNDSIDIYDWRHDNPCATYLYTFAVDNYSILNIPGAKVPIMIFSLSSDTIASKYAYNLVPKFVDAYESRFCNYPLDKVGYVNSVCNGGMESESMINIDTTEVRKAYRTHDSVNYTIAHELAHQWFGDYVTCRDFRDAWLSEGFATLCDAICLEYFYGYFSFLDNIGNNINSYFTYSKIEGVFPLYNYPRKLPSSNYPVTIYWKGAAVLAMLRYELGDSLFFGALNYYLDKHAYSTVTTQMLKSELESYTGHDLTLFFNQWIYRLGWPILNITVQGSKTTNPDLYSAKVHITQIQPSSYGTYSNVPIELGFRRPDQSLIFKILKLTEIDQTFIIDSLPEFVATNVNKGPSLRSLIQVTKLTTDVQDQTVTVPYFEIYPNPASSEIKVVYSNMSSNNTISIINPLGQILLESRNNTNNDENYLNLNVSDYPQGIYFLKLGNGTNVEIKKFVISR
jgi:aminopeptidase N